MISKLVSNSIRKNRNTSKKKLKNTQHILVLHTKILYSKNSLTVDFSDMLVWPFLVVHGGLRRARRRFTLVALCKKAKCINLFDEIAHTGPSTKSKPNNQNPAHYKYVNGIHYTPAWHEGWWLLCSILQFLFKKSEWV